MDYEHITPSDQKQLVEGSLRDLEAQHMQACINLAANKGVPGFKPNELEQRRDALALGIRNLRREYAALLAEPVEVVEPEPMTEEELAAFERAQTNSIMDVVERSMEEPQRNGQAHNLVTVD